MRIGLVGVGRIGAFHARTLSGLPVVDSVVLSDADPGRAEETARRLGVETAPDVEALFAAGLDGVVIASSTSSHAGLIRRGVKAGVPTFCEKPISLELTGTGQVVDLVEASDVPVQIGFQRRFDPGYQEAARAVATGELGFLHHISAVTGDVSPPSADYLRTSGGFFRDCSVHDFDAIRYLTGREFVDVYAVGANRGEPLFTEVDDVDSAAALLTLDDRTLVSVTGTRYNGAGHDVRMELSGSGGTLDVGLDDHTPVRSAENAVKFPLGPPHASFMDRFAAAYVAELTAFTEVVAGARAVPCTVRDAMEAFRVADACDRSRREGRVVRLDESPRITGTDST